MSTLFTSGITAASKSSPNHNCGLHHHCCFDPRNGYSCPYLTWIKDKVTRDCKTSLKSVSTDHHEKKEVEQIIDTIDYYFGLMMHEMDLERKNREPKTTTAAANSAPIVCTCSSGTGCTCKVVYYHRPTIPFQLERNIDKVEKEHVYLPFSYDVSLLEKTKSIISSTVQQAVYDEPNTDDTPYKPRRMTAQEFIELAISKNGCFPSSPSKFKAPSVAKAPVVTIDLTDDISLDDLENDNNDSNISINSQVGQEDDAACNTPSNPFERRIPHNVFFGRRTTTSTSIISTTTTTTAMSRGQGISQLPMTTITRILDIDDDESFELSFPEIAFKKQPKTLQEYLDESTVCDNTLTETEDSDATQVDPLTNDLLNTTFIFGEEDFNVEQNDDMDFDSLCEVADTLLTLGQDVNHPVVVNPNTANGSRKRKLDVTLDSNKRHKKNV